MKTIGTQVQFLRPDSRYCRRGEGAFLRLDSGAILNVYSAYPGPDWNDHAEAELAAQISDDGGKTWSPERTIIRRDPDAVNVMSVSLLPMQDGAAGLFYIQKYRREGRIVDRYLLRRSYDGGMTWGESSVCIPDTTYSIINNDRVVRLSDGRIAIPVSQCETDPDDPYRLSPGFVCLFRYPSGFVILIGRRLSAAVFRGLYLIRSVVGVFHMVVVSYRLGGHVLVLIIGIGRHAAVRIRKGL